ncbi:hypothetical protein TNCV_1989611 [Trichonephila clavipes]|nr:hypothetical protein TNCV_1989611 [Trichonephila clavipes]
MQNWEKPSVVGEKCRDLHAWEEEEALCKTSVLRKKGNASAVPHEFRSRKNLRRGPMSNLVIRAMIKRFEETGTLCIYIGVQSGRGRKRGTPVLVDDVKTVVDAQSQTSQFEGSSARAVSL